MIRPIACVLALVTLVCLAPGCKRDRSAGKRLIVLGVDGMDPGFLERHQDALPNLAALRQRGGFRRLATTIPPQSPVAWSTFITGLDPGGHGVFDFVHRNPSNLQPFSSMAETVEPAHNLSIGPYRLPLSPGHVRLLRQGTPFWQLLDDAGIPATIIHIPNNFPPSESGAVSLAGMGTPDLPGDFGTFTFFTDDPEELARDVSGGRVVPVRRDQRGHVALPVPGPANTLRKDRASTSVELTVDIDPQSPAARFRLGDEVFMLNEHEWSGWIHADFALIRHLKSVRGMFRVYAQQFHPALRVYVSPVNIDPVAPALPLSNPSSYSRRLAEAIGPYYTQGIAEDTAIYRSGLFNLKEYRTQSGLVADEQIAMLRRVLAEYHSGLLFFYFSTLDQDSHMLWGKHEAELLASYKRVDDAVGLVAERAGPATLIVMSDHGFTSFNRAFHLNTWLRNEGFLELEDRDAPSAAEGFAGVAWRKTQAYAIGLNGLYVNLAGREKNGIVAGEAARAEVLRQITERLLALRDPTNGAVVVDAVYEPRKVFAKVTELAPDLIVGYAPGYRGSWQTALGAVPERILEDNTDAWIGDHCVDPRAVPGVLLANRTIRLNDPGLADLTVTILREFGVKPTPEMLGRPVF
jgi:predicted AlkP superfamily phosphohydrolase/phosphomutase